MAIAPKKPDAVVFMLPEGRVINNSLFDKDAFTPTNGGAPGKASYKLELAFDPSDELTAIEDHMADTIAAAYGEKAAQDFLDRANGVTHPMKDGNRMAAKRDEKGKSGDAYKGKLVIRMSTEYDREGKNGPAGAKVFGPNVETIGKVEGNTGEVYNGCYGIAAVTFKAFRDSKTDEPGVTVYLNAFQKTRDAEPLRGTDNTSSLFKPAGGVAGVAAEGRRRRAG